MKNLINNKGISIGLKILKGLFFLIVLLVMIFTLISVTSFDKDKGNGILGVKFFTVLSDSMQSEFVSGDVIITKNANISNLKEGDIITFKSIDPASFGEVVTHKIRSKTTHDGKIAFITYGTTTGSDDKYPALAEKIIGQYVFSIPNGGYFFEFLKSTTGYFTVIFIPFMLLIILEIIKFIGIARKYKKEQREEIDQKNAEIAEEKLKVQKMMDELQELRNQMNDKNEKSA